MLLNTSDSYRNRERNISSENADQWRFSPEHGDLSFKTWKSKSLSQNLRKAKQFYFFFFNLEPGQSKEKKSGGRSESECFVLRYFFTKSGSFFLAWFFTGILVQSRHVPTWKKQCTSHSNSWLASCYYCVIRDRYRLLVMIICNVGRHICQKGNTNGKFHEPLLTWNFLIHKCEKKFCIKSAKIYTWESSKQQIRVCSLKTADEKFQKKFVINIVISYKLPRNYRFFLCVCASVWPNRNFSFFELNQSISFRYISPECFTVVFSMKLSFSRTSATALKASLRSCVEQFAKLQWFWCCNFLVTFFLNKTIARVWLFKIPERSATSFRTVWAKLWAF